MLENFKQENKKSELFEAVMALRPKFKNNIDAISFYSNALEKVCSSTGKTVDELIVLAENQTTYDPQLMKVLSLARIITGLKSQG